MLASVTDTGLVVPAIVTISPLVDDVVSVDVDCNDVTLAALI